MESNVINVKEMMNATLKQDLFTLKIVLGQPNVG